MRTESFINRSDNTLRYFCALTCLVLIFSLAFHFLARSRKRALLAVLALVYLFVGIGIAPLIATVAVFLGSFFLGRFLLLPFGQYAASQEPVSAIASLMVGLGFYLLCFSVASCYAVNSLSFYILALLPPLVFALKEQNFSGASYLIHSARKMLTVIDGWSCL